MTRVHRLTIRNTMRHWLLLPLALSAAIAAALRFHKRNSA